MRPRVTGVRVMATLVAIAGVILIVGGVVTWIAVQNQLDAENITVADDADMLAGDEVNGPLSAYAQADVINEHALAETEGQTYAELDREDERRQVVMTASFLRASLFTSVVAFGLAAMAAGLGLVLLFIAVALFGLARAVGVAPVVPDR
ncbi:MAG: aromatic ring-opening dioxygenase LigA [Jiangellaceae bacterium]|nr:aromatic ring-opening dioxygenase LigA [Jiangellaceae bacterium]